MDVQLRRGILDVCVLRAIEGGESYGYRIIKEVSPHVTISESTLYPILKRLEAGGQLTSRTDEYNGRLRRYYDITDEGKGRIRAFLEEWSEMMRIYAYIKGETEQ